MIHTGHFPVQVDNASVTQNLFFIVSSTAVVLALLGLILIDTGLVRRQNVLNTAIQKIIGFVIGAGAYMIAGFGLWNYQYYKAFGIEGSFTQAIKDWWLGGNYMTEYAQKIDPSAAPGAGNSQIFFVFLAIYGGFVCALVHTAASERIKAGPFYFMSAAIGGIIYPILLWLTWGSTSPLTNAGLHDFVGAFTAYIFAGIFGLVLTYRLKARSGLFPTATKPSTWAPNSVPLAALGVVVLMTAAPFIVMGCGFIVPDDGFYGISMTTSGLGLVYVNVFAAFVAGGAVGAYLAYRSGNVVHALLGPISGYVACTTGFDVLKPWEIIIVAAVSPLVVAGAYNALAKRQIDDSKVAPLAAATVFGVVVVGFFAWGTPTGGYFGLHGKYAFQHAEITPWWQILGLVVTAAIALISAAILVYGLDKIVGLRVSEHDELEGLDVTQWSPAATADV